MGSQVCETLALINGDDRVQINGDALLMSLMEEPLPSDESDNDDDRLDSLIRSFEAEISGSNNKMGDGDDFSSSSMKGSEFISNNNNIMEEFATTQSWKKNNMGEIDYHGVECWGDSSSSSEFGREWMDMDCFVPSSPFDDRSWCVVEPCGDHEYAMANNFKLGYDGFALGEHGYNLLCQDMACN